MGCCAPFLAVLVLLNCLFFMLKMRGCAEASTAGGASDDDFGADSSSSEDAAHSGSDSGASSSAGEAQD